MNLKIKYRESFRPFAPSVLRERVSDYFEMDTDSPYMLLVAPVAEKRRVALQPDQEQLWGIELLNVPKSDIPAVTHVDYSARVQTVTASTNPRYYQLLRAFEEQTGCGVFGVITLWPLVVRGEDIRMWACILAGLFGVWGTVFPTGLKSVYRVWMIFREKIWWMNSRILLGLVFYGLLPPSHG